MKDTMSGSRKGKKADGTPVRTATSEPITRRQKNGDLLTAWSSAAMQELDPLEALAEIEREWRRA